MFKQVVPISFPGQLVSVPDNTWLLWTEPNGSLSKKANQEASLASSPIWGKSKKRHGLFHARAGDALQQMWSMMYIFKDLTNSPANLKIPSSFVFEMSPYFGGIKGTKKATCRARGQRRHPCPPRRPSRRASGTFELCHSSPLGHAFKCLGMRLQPS